MHSRRCGGTLCFQSLPNSFDNSPSRIRPQPSGISHLRTLPKTTEGCHLISSPHSSPGTRHLASIPLATTRTQKITPLESVFTQAALASPLESALTQNARATPLESALTIYIGGGVGTRSGPIVSFPLCAVVLRPPSPPGGWLGG